MTFFEFRRYVAGRNAHLHHEHHDVICKVGNLEHGFLFAAAFARDDDFGALLAYFFQNFVHALFKEIRGVRPVLWVGLSPFDEVVQRLVRELLVPFRNPDGIVETTFLARMTGGSVLDDFDDERVVIAVCGDGDDVLIIAARFAFQPQLFA